MPFVIGAQSAPPKSYGKLSASLIHFWPGNGMRIRTKAQVAIDTWVHVAMTYDGSSRAAGLRIFVNGEEAACDVVRDHLVKNITGGGGDVIVIGERMRDRGFTNGLVDDFVVAGHQLSTLEVRELMDGGLGRALVQAPEKLSVADRALLYEQYLMNVNEAWSNKEYERF